MRREAVGIVLAILVVASLGVGYVAGNNGARSIETIASTSASVSTSTLTSKQTVVSSVTVVSSTTVENNVTTTITSTLHTMSEPIPIASVETANITVGGASGTIAVNPDTNRIYIPARSSLIVIDASSHSMISNITLPSGARGGIAIDYDTNTVYASMVSGIAEINGSTNEVIGELPLNLAAGSLMAYSPQAHMIYGVSESGYSLIGADVRTGSIVANISLGYRAGDMAIDLKTNMVYIDGCTLSGTECPTKVSIVNGTSGTLVTTEPTYLLNTVAITIDPTTNVVYTAGGPLLALNGSNGNVIFHTSVETCGLFLGMAVIPSTDQVLMIPADYNYLLVYNGVSGALVNMYSFPSSPQSPWPSSLESVAYNPTTDELYVTTPAGFLSFHDFPITGNVNSTLVGSNLGCAQ